MKFPDYKVFSDVVIIASSHWETLNTDNKIALISKLARENAELPIVHLNLQRIGLTPESIRAAAIQDKYVAHRLQLQLDRELTIAEKTIIETYTNATKALESLAAIIKASMPVKPYPFVTVSTPQNIHDTTLFTLSKTRIRRKGGSYFILFSEALKVWNIVSKYWSDPTVHYCPGSQYLATETNGQERLTFYSHRVEVGCQTIHRAELEQLAVHLNWPMPEII